MEIRDVYIVDHVRTPFSRSRPRAPPKDIFGNIRVDEFGAITLNEMFDNRLPKKGSTLKPENVDEFIVGVTHFNFEYNLYGGRNILFMAKFPSKNISSLAMDRQCGSAQTCAAIGYNDIALGYSDVVLATGTNNATMSRGQREPPNMEGKVTPMKRGGPQMTPGHEFFVNDPKADYVVDFGCTFSMLQTAQKLSELRQDVFTKEDLDKFSVRSHLLAEKGQKSGFFKEEIVPIMGHEVGDVGAAKLIENDNSVRSGATLEKTANLRGLSRPGWAGGYFNPLMTKEEYVARYGTEHGIITAGNSCPTNAGASTLLLASKEACDKYNMTPRAKLISIGFGAVDPTVMGRGPVPASWMALKHAGLKLDDIDKFEINEAFAIVGLNWVHEMGLMERMDDVNVHGGAIAIGHPISATGPRMTGTMMNILKESGKKYGLTTMCCGGGQGTAHIIESLET
jgi:acetyl-CoA C-acetyltransferase